jgi:hypothetical protein
MVSAALPGACLCWPACVRCRDIVKHPRPCAERDWSLTESQKNDCAGEKRGREESGSTRMGCFGDM